MARKRYSAEEIVNRLRETDDPDPIRPRLPPTS